MQAYIAAKNGWESTSVENSVLASGNGVIEMSIPLTSFGEISAGDDIGFVVVTQPDGDLLPQSGPGRFLLPDLGLSELIFTGQRPGKRRSWSWNLHLSNRCGIFRPEL